MKKVTKAGLRYSEAVAVSEKRMPRPSTAWQLLRQILGLFAIAWLVLMSSAVLANQVLARHPLEIQALTEPEAVLNSLTALLNENAGNPRELARLYLAKANACRVMADWPCQADAGMRAAMAAETAKQAPLQVRGLIAESRGRMAMQDFIVAEAALVRAEQQLQREPNAALQAEIMLAYSSMSEKLAIPANALRFAERGLTALAAGNEPGIQLRLQRNQARALAELGRHAESERVLREATANINSADDPKLQAELELEMARVARVQNDVVMQRASGHRILHFAEQLHNSQLLGLGHEVLGLASLAEGKHANAERELNTAMQAFRQREQWRDERRVVRSLLAEVLLESRQTSSIAILSARLLALDKKLETEDRNLAAHNFTTQRKYAEQQFAVQKLKAEAALAAEKEIAAEIRQRATLITAALSIGLLLSLGVFSVFQRRARHRLQKLNSRLQDSERQYRLLAEHSRDLVVHMRLSGERLYVSPSVQEMLGYLPAEMMQPHWELIHPEDTPALQECIAKLVAEGGTTSFVYRCRHQLGHYIWIEALARLVPPVHGGAQAEIIYSGRDVSARIEAELALRESEKRLRAIADNVPAFIAQINPERRYRFANAYIGKRYQRDAESIIGMSMRELRGHAVADAMEPHIQKVLNGERVRFEANENIDGAVYHYQSSYVPDLDSNGNVQGFYSLSFDISELKRAEAKLTEMARIDSLTGVANRRHFDEQLHGALARARRDDRPAALLCLDIDHFKAINDQYGHPVGDAVISTFSKRLLACVREVDLVARLGGDEFAILIENAQAGSAETIAEKILVAMREPILVEAQSLLVTTSIGAAYCRQGSSDADFFKLADQALYEAKKAGRSRYHAVPAQGCLGQ